MAGRSIQGAIRREADMEWPLIAGKGGPDEAVAAVVSLDPGISDDEGYRLTISQTGIKLVGRTPAGAFYGAQTLAQLIRLFPANLPALEIEDSPDFPARGVMLDISRDKVPTMQTLYELVDLLASMKVNQLQLYTEHTFAYRAHREVWERASPMTGQEILQLDAYCKQRFIDLVPNQNSFGHLDRWLKHERYRPLAEAPDGFEFPWGHHDGPFSLCPVDPGSIKLIAELHDELLPHFSSTMFNVGCDETWDVGQGRSKREVAERGRERVYLDFLLKVHALVRKHGRRMQFWGDIILHKPELIGQIPRDVIALEWGYEADHPFDKDGALFKKAGVPFYVCPGTSSWMSIAGADRERGGQPAQRRRERAEAWRHRLSQYRLGRLRPPSVSAHQLPGFRGRRRIFVEPCRQPGSVHHGGARRPCVPRFGRHHGPARLRSGRRL